MYSPFLHFCLLVMICAFYRGVVHFVRSTKFVDVCVHCVLLVLCILHLSRYVGLMLLGMFCLAGRLLVGFLFCTEVDNSLLNSA